MVTVPPVKTGAKPNAKPAPWYIGAIAAETRPVPRPHSSALM